jgi:hypothetical protein
MTEFEIAQLEIMQVERNMSAINAITSTTGLVQADIANWLALLFGYLLVAYFIGANLTRMQVIILNALYIASVGFLTFTIVSTSSVVSRLLDLLRGLTVRDTEVMSMSLTAQWFAMALNLTMILASLYFMWSIRHPKAE